MALPDESPNPLPPAPPNRLALDVLAAVMMLAGWLGLTGLTFTFGFRAVAAWMCASLLVAGGVLGYDSERR